MVVYSIGKPDHKSREVEGQMPYEEWIYGDPPHDVEFVRINGNRVIRVAMAKAGQDLDIHDKNEVEGIVQAEERQVQIGGDTVSNPDVAQKAPPTLKGAGETLPSDKNPGSMGPVIFPEGMGKQKPLPPDLQQAPVSVDDDPAGETCSEGSECCADARADCSAGSAAGSCAGSKAGELGGEEHALTLCRIEGASRHSSVSSLPPQKGSSCGIPV